MNKSQNERYEELRKQTCRLSAKIFLPILSVSVVGYLIVRFFAAPGNAVNLLAVILNAFVAATGFAAIFVSVQTDKEIKRYEFVADYNFHFLTSEKFFDIERKLESCYQEYEKISIECKETWGEEQKIRFLKYCDDVFGTKDCLFSDDPNAPNTRKGKNGVSMSKEYQKIVNYLVYLESFVPLLQSKQLLYCEIDNLFGYRYFIAVNNPVLQKNELIRERDFYRGCIAVYSDWKQHRNNVDAKIPLSAFDLGKQIAEAEQRSKEMNSIKASEETSEEQ